ncbi:hypothetical protein ACQ4PT_015626 [Festuca glaucescens]
MGCGGSKEDVATGNTTAANGAGRGTKLFRRKSTMSASHRSSQASSSSSDGTSVAIKDVVKEPAAGVPKAADVEVASDEKPVAAVVEEKKEEEVAVKKDFAAPGVAATVVTKEAAQLSVKEEDELPKSTMADEAPAVDEVKVDEAKEAAVAKEAKEESPASTNEGGKSAGQSTTEPMEAKPVDVNKVDVAAPVPASSLSQENTAAGAAN